MAYVKVYSGSKDILLENDDVVIAAIAGAFYEAKIHGHSSLLVQLEGRKTTEYLSIPFDAVVEFQHDVQVDTVEAQRLLDAAKPTIEKFGSIAFDAEGQILPLR